jgi:DUF1680 family protein
MSRPLLTRRKLLRGISVAGGLGLLRGVPRFSADANIGNKLPAPPLVPLDYRQVQLDPGPMQSQFEHTHSLLMNLADDDLLRPFRLRSNRSAPGTDLGGWYDAYAFAPGSTFGQWVSALSRDYAATKDQATRAKIDRLVRGYAATVDPAGSFYLENRFPAYTYDKIVCGLIDAHTFASLPSALDTLGRATEAAAPHLPGRAIPRTETPMLHHEDMKQHAWDESYILGENLLLAWQRSGNYRYLEMARRYLPDSDYFDPLARGENVLPGRHAYSHVNALSSAAAAFSFLGDPKYLAAAKNGFAMVQAQSYATGGWGPNEHFVVPGTGKLAASLDSTHASFETPCGSYAHFKITRYLLGLTGDSRYGDSMERVLYNTILGASPMQPDGRAFYYSDYHPQAVKVFAKDKWPCCSGTFPQIAADYRISAYFLGGEQRGLYVNLYVPSTVTWLDPATGTKFSLLQTTQYPYAPNIRFDVMATKAATFSLYLRIPQWADDAAVTLNQVRDSRKLVPGSFAEIRREWKSGDRVELEVPLHTRLEGMEAIAGQTPNRAALLVGPLVLMAAPADQNAWSRTALLSAQQAPGQGRRWSVRSDSNILRLRPFADIEDQSYTTYLNVLP